MATINLDDTTSIVIGRVGENDSVSIAFDYSAWVTEFGEGTLVLNFLRPTEDVPYPVTLECADGTATWLVSSTDTAISGVGQAQFTYSVDSIIKKSRILSAIILRSIGISGQVPDPYDAWLAEMQEIAQLTVGYGELAQTSSETAVSAKTDAETASESAQNSATSASADASSASASATSASGSASPASTSATNASESAQSASQSATSANTDAQTASAAASQATAAAENAQRYADELSGSILHFADADNDGNIVITAGGSES